MKHYAQYYGKEDNVCVTATVLLLKFMYCSSLIIVCTQPFILNHCRYGHLNVVKYLVNEANCDPIIRDNGGETPLHIASR